MRDRNTENATVRGKKIVKYLATTKSIVVGALESTFLTWPSMSQHTRSPLSCLHRIGLLLKLQKQIGNND